MSILKSLTGFLIVVSLCYGCASVSNSDTVTNKPASISAKPDLKTVAPIENGWGPNPRELSNAKDINSLTDANWYTKKYSGKANERSKELKSISYMESTCRQAVKKENGKALIESAFTSLSQDIKQEALSQIMGSITQDDLKNVEASNCKPTAADNSFSECECSLSYKVEGGKKAIMDKLSPISK